MLCNVCRLTEEKKEVESDIQRQPKAEVRTYVMPITMLCAKLPLMASSSVMLHCTTPVVGPLVVVGCRAEDEGADQ